MCAGGAVGRACVARAAELMVVLLPHSCCCRTRGATNSCAVADVADAEVRPTRRRSGVKAFACRRWRAAKRPSSRREGPALRWWRSDERAAKRAGAERAAAERTAVERAIERTAT